MTGPSRHRSVRRRLALLAATAVVFAAPAAAPAAADAAFGAIAINPSTGGFGVSYDYATKARAKKRALRECPGRCRIALWVRNQCGAVVEGRRRYVAGFGETKRKAIRNARKRANGPRERVVAWTCSG